MTDTEVVGQSLKGTNYKPAFLEVYIKKQSDKNSVTLALVRLLVIIDDPILPIASLDLRSEKQYLIESQLLRARIMEDWYDMDIILLAKILKMCADTR